MLNTEYYSHKFIGLDKEAKSVLGKAYLIRQEPWSNPKWVEIYADWLIATKHKFQKEEEGLKQMRTMAVFYFEKIKVDKDGLIKKDVRLEGYDSLKDYAKHEMKKRTDIYYVPTEVSLRRTRLLDAFILSDKISPFWT